MSEAGETASSRERSEPRSLAEKLEDLLTVLTPSGQWPPSNEDVATAINIAAGEKTNPTVRHLEALAQYCGVSAAYFLDEEESRRIDAQLRLLDTLKKSDAQNIALRSTDLSESSRRALHGMIDQLRKLEGLSAADDFAGRDGPSP